MAAEKPDLGCRSDAQGGRVPQRPTPSRCYACISEHRGARAEQVSVRRCRCGRGNSRGRRTEDGSARKGGRGRCP